MVRIKKGKIAHRRHKKILKRAKGFRGSLRRLYRPAKQAVTKALTHSYSGRKLKKRSFRNLWVIRINAAAREHGLSYSRLMSGLKKAGVALDRKILAELALSDSKAFAVLATQAKNRGVA